MDYSFTRGTDGMFKLDLTEAGPGWVCVNYETIDTKGTYRYYSVHIDFPKHSTEAPKTEVFEFLKGCWEGRRLPESEHEYVRPLIIDAFKDVDAATIWQNDHPGSTSTANVGASD